MQLNPLPPPPSVLHYAHNVRYVIIVFINPNMGLQITTSLNLRRMVPIWQFAISDLAFPSTKY